MFWYTLLTNIFFYFLPIFFWFFCIFSFPFFLIFFLFMWGHKMGNNMRNPKIVHGSLISQCNACDNMLIVWISPKWLEISDQNSTLDLVLTWFVQSKTFYVFFWILMSNAKKLFMRIIFLRAHKFFYTKHA